jgi:hypothetical protein
MTSIVVSRRDGILTAPDGTKHRVARGKTLADADHPAVLANPRDWTPMVVELSSGTERSAATLPEGADELAEQVAELDETLAQRDAELSRLADGYASLGHSLPAEEDREPGWLVDLVLHELREGATAARAQAGPAAARSEALTKLDKPEPAAAPPIAPPKPRKRTSPPLVTRTGDDD